MNNEPVAWINRHMNDGWLSWDKNSNADSSTPLYTHPAKTLTDEEIIGCSQDVKYSELSIAVNDFYILFARAILRKAQEK
jgi:hypothetical protein